ncbi:MAG: protein-glutamate O-methyltransferase CheR [Deltaproteobacteria bacterium]|nr:protein-glutamate O-methyltransferase CheR [Deltaproteobacteria bacterium]
MEDDREFKFLLDKIKRNRGIDFSQYRPRLIECITIKVSKFFRDSKVFDLLEDIIIPEIISQKKTEGTKKIHAWSCGAAFGEEAYSVAILLCEALGSRLNDFDIQILATDIDKNALAEAPWGSYDRNALGNMGAHLLFKYFTRFQDRYVVSDGARSLVTFRRHDIASGSPMWGMDLVLCRNLLIYFQKELQEKALHNIYTALNPGGFLVLGMTETIIPQMLEYFDVVDLRKRIYRKL